MTNTDVIKKLIGNINPVGETNTDNERFENLKEMCDLVNNLITDIDDMAYRNRDSHEFSVKRASEYASNFLTKTVGISE
jgi:uncharacterized protein YaaR (DUF327 family)